MPGLVEGDDHRLYALKWSGAAQGRKALVAEVLAGELGRALGLPVPELVRLDLDPVLARSEPEQQIQEQMRPAAASTSGWTSSAARSTSTRSASRWTRNSPGGCSGSTR